jgi:hypothetical protein
MNRDQVTNPVAALLDPLLPAGERRCVDEGNVGSMLDREGREARDLVRLLALLQTLRLQTAVP